MVAIIVIVAIVVLIVLGFSLHKPSRKWMVTQLKKLKKEMKKTEIDNFVFHIALEELRPKAYKLVRSSTQKLQSLVKVAIDVMPLPEGIREEIESAIDSIEAKRVSTKLVDDLFEEIQTIYNKHL